MLLAGGEFILSGSKKKVYIDWKFILTRVYLKAADSTVTHSQLRAYKYFMAVAMYFNMASMQLKESKT